VCPPGAQRSGQADARDAFQRGELRRSNASAERCSPGFGIDIGVTRTHAPGEEGCRAGETHPSRPRTVAPSACDYLCPLSIGVITRRSVPSGERHRPGRRLIGNNRARCDWSNQTDFRWRSRPGRTPSVAGRCGLSSAHVEEPVQTGSWLSVVPGSQVSRWSSLRWGFSDLLPLRRGRQCPTPQTRFVVPMLSRHRCDLNLLAIRGRSAVSLACGRRRSHPPSMRLATTTRQQIEDFVQL
jgi:hypothetical protein